MATLDRVYAAARNLASTVRLIAAKNRRYQTQADRMREALAKQRDELAQQKRESRELQDQVDPIRNPMIEAAPAPPVATPESQGIYDEGDGIHISVLNIVSVLLATDPGLEFDAGKLRAKVSGLMGLARTADGIEIKLPDISGLGLASDGLSVQPKDAGGLDVDTGGVFIAIKADSALVTDVDGLAHSVPAGALEQKFGGEAGNYIYSITTDQFGHVIAVEVGDF